MSGTLFVLEISSEKKLKPCHQEYCYLAGEPLNKEEMITQSDQNLDKHEPMEL